MVGHRLRGLERKLRKSRGGSLARPRRGRQPWIVEGLEDRLLLSGSPTIYTVNSTGNGTTGTGDSGTLPYVISQANSNANTAGSEIQFDPTVFASAQTITLASTLVLSETSRAGGDRRPRRERRDGQWRRCRRGFSVTSGVKASFTGLTISGGLAVQGGGLSVDRRHGVAHERRRDQRPGCGGTWDARTCRSSRWPRRQRFGRRHLPEWGESDTDG